MALGWGESGGTNRSSWHDKHRGVRTIELFVVAFFWCSGGIYGNESLLAAAPTGWAFLAVILGSIFYALPIALISVELACAVPYDGGLVAWVEEACGARIGGHNVWWLWISYIFAASSYPLVAAEYVAPRLHMNDIAKSLLSDLIIICITLVKLGGSDYIMIATGSLFLVSILPFSIYILYGVKELDPIQWFDYNTTEDAGGIDEPMLFSWTMWLYSGFFSIGALAGETVDPARAYPLIIALLVPLITLFIVLPLLVSVSIDATRSEYHPGHIDHLATELCGDWLGILFIMGAFCCYIGLYNARMIVCERSMAAFLGESVAELSARYPERRVLKYLLTENGLGVAPVFIIFNAILTSTLVWLPYEVLVGFSVLKMCPVALLFLYSYLWYRVKQPELVRPFKVPGGHVGAVLTTLPIFGLTLVTFYLGNVSGDEVLGVKHANMYSFILIISIGVIVNIVYLVLLRYRDSYHREWTPPPVAEPYEEEVPFDRESTPWDSVAIGDSTALLSPTRTSRDTPSRSPTSPYGSTYEG